MHTAVVANLPVLFSCDCFPAVQQTVASHSAASGAREVVIHGIGAINDAMPILVNMGGVVTIGLVTSGVHRGAPLHACCSFALPTRPAARLHETLSRSKSGMIKQCADDTAALLRSAPLLASLALAREGLPEPGSNRPSARWSCWPVGVGPRRRK